MDNMDEVVYLVSQRTGIAPEQDRSAAGLADPVQGFGSMFGKQ